MYSNDLKPISDSQLAQPCTCVLPLTPSSFLVGSGQQLLLFTQQDQRLCAKSVKVIRSPVRSLHPFSEDKAIVAHLHGVSILKVGSKIKPLMNVQIDGGVLYAAPVCH